MKGYVSLALLLSFAFCGEKVNTESTTAMPAAAPTAASESTTTSAAITTPAPTTMLESTTSSAPNSTSAPTATLESTTPSATNTTPAPTATLESTTPSAPNSTSAPTATLESTTPSAPNSTSAPTATLESTTSSAPNSTSAPTATLESTTPSATNTTPAPTATLESTTSSAPNSTSAPTATLESTTPSAPNSTSAPTATLESTTPSAPNTTPAPRTTQINTTTQVPTNTTGTNSSTAPLMTTKLPVTTAPPATTEAPLPCANKPCNGSAKCINLYQDYTCQCAYGYYYTTSGCQEGKVFPGQFTVNETYSDSMANESSSEYEKLYKIITDFFKRTFIYQTDYEETIIVNIKQSSAKSKIQNKAGTSGTSVTVRNMFKVTTKLNSSEVTKLIEDAMKGNSNFNSDSYEALSQCAIYGCDEATTTCQDTDGVTCECKSGFSKKDPEDKSCSGCDNTCSEEKHLHCVIDRNNVPVCQCLPNFQNKDGNCVECDVGYSGVNCSNNSLLILIIVAPLCGALILGLTVGLIFTSLRANKRQRNPEKRHLLTEDYLNKRDTPEHVSAINSAANDKIFPIIRTSNASQVNRGFEMSSPYEMTPPTRLPERDYDEVEYEISPKGDGFRLQRRY